MVKNINNFYSILATIMAPSLAQNHKNSLQIPIIFLKLEKYSVQFSKWDGSRLPGIDRLWWVGSKKKKVE